MNIFDENDVPTKEYYLFLKHNKIFDKDNLQLTSYEEELYLEFCRLYEEFKLASSVSDSTKASTLFGAISSMFGYNRHYCSITGQPIIGSYQKIGGKIVSKEAYESYKIIQEMEKRHSPEKKKNIKKPNIDKNIPNKK